MDHLDDNRYEYPDPELLGQNSFQVWPTQNVDDQGNPDDPRLQAIASTVRSAWPNGEGEGNDDEEDEEDLAIAGLASGAFDTEYQDEQEPNQSDDDESVRFESEIEARASNQAQAGGRPRGRGRGRGKSRGRGRGRVRSQGLLKRSVEETLDNPRNHKTCEQNPKSGRKGNKSTVRRGIRKTLPASAKFAELQGAATNYFIQGNFEKAEQLANEAVVENPEQFSAHALLSEIFYERGDLERSIAALFAGAHVRQRDPEVWERSAELIVERSGDLRHSKMLEDAIYCYSRCIALDGERSEVRVARARLHRENGHVKKAIKDLQFVLKRNPNNISIIKMLIEFFVEIGDDLEACILYEELIKVIQESEPETAVSFDWADLHAYGGHLLSQNTPKQSLIKLKRTARWICGRGDDNYWDSQTIDDREFDIDEEPRRAEVKSLAQTNHDNSAYGEAIPLEVRVQFGLCRLQLDHFDEAMLHLDFLTPTSEDPTMVEDFSDLYRMAGEAFRGKKRWSDALKFFEPVREFVGSGESAFYAHLAHCYRQLGRYDEAEKCYRTLMAHSDKDMKARREMIAMFHEAEMRHRAEPYENVVKQKRKRQYRPMYNQKGKDDRIAFEDRPGDTRATVAQEDPSHQFKPVYINTIDATAQAFSGEIHNGQPREDEQVHIDTMNNTAQPVSRPVTYRLEPAINTTNRTTPGFSQQIVYRLQPRGGSSQQSQDKRVYANSMNQSVPALPHQFVYRLQPRVNPSQQNQDNPVYINTTDENALRSSHQITNIAEPMVNSFDFNRDARTYINTIPAWRHQITLSSLEQNQDQRVYFDPTSQTIQAISDGIIHTLEPVIDSVERGSDEEDGYEEEQEAEAQPAAKNQKRQHHRKKVAEAEQQEDLQPSFLRMADLRASIEEGDQEAREEWIFEARSLLRQFREARIFFPHDRNIKFYGYTAEARAKSFRTKQKQIEHEQELAEMLNVPVEKLPQAPIPTTFCYVSFETWLDIFLEYAIMLGEDGKKQESYSVLEICSACNVFYSSKRYMALIHLTQGVCAIHAEDEDKIGVVARYFMTAYQFTTDAYRLYIAMFRLCPRPNLGYFNLGVFQKFIMRQLKAVDFCIATPEERTRPMFEERSGFFNKDESGNPIVPTKFDIELLFLYGQILYSAGSYMYALNYLYRARSLDPDHPLINLTLGLAYIHHGIKRQSLNRHQMIMQGLVFIYQYYDKRMKSDLPAERQEALYNLGRTFHLLGLIHLAIPKYEKVLELAEEIRDSRDTNINEEESKHAENFAVDAAFTLQGLYGFAGNMIRAKEIVDKWMVL